MNKDLALRVIKSETQEMTAERIAELYQVIKNYEEQLKLKLYVWENVLTDWNSGIAFAYAENSEEARQLILKKLGYTHEDLSKSPRLIEQKEGFYVYGGG